MTRFRDYVDSVEETAGKAFDAWVKDMDAYHSSPQLMKDAFRSFFIGGYLKGSASGADATFNAAKRAFKGEAA